MITGSNNGLGKDAARQLALMNETEKIYLAVRNEEKGRAAQKELEQRTGKTVFEVIKLDTSDLDSVRSAVEKLEEPIDALIMNAGGMGGKTPRELTKDGATVQMASNVLGHALLVDELLTANKLRNVALFSSSEAVRGVDKMDIAAPGLSTSSEEEFASVIDGSYFGEEMDPMEGYALAKYVGTMWMSSMARRYPHIRFISMSPGGTSGTAAMDDLPPKMRFMFKYIMMPIVMPLRGLVHKVEVGAKRYVDGINDTSLKSGVFYASHAPTITGPITDQTPLYPDLANETYQDNAYAAVQRFVRKAERISA